MAKGKATKAKKVVARGSKAEKKASAGALGLPLKVWTSSFRKAKGAEARSGRRGFVFVMAEKDPKALKKLLSGHLNRWQTAAALEGESEVLSFQGSNGPVWILVRTTKGNSKPASDASLEKSAWARIRDLMGGVFTQMQPYRLEKLVFETVGLSQDEERALIVGLELAAYSYAENRPQAPKTRRSLPTPLLKAGGEGLASAAVREAGALGLAVNIARHYTNLPGGDLNPRTYAESIESLFEDSSSVTVDTWHGEKLESERMGLLLAVGRGAVEGPRFVHLGYRPKNRAIGVRPIALVGKGVTFDSGGLDIKPSSAMRLMKKDMGGSAAVVALVKWAEMTELDLPIDAYVSLAENSVGSRSFRPGDVVLARNGLTIEIGNTDAEGRLVMADALDVAVEGKPQAVIDVATLTGAIKVGLGAEVAGLFTNSDNLASIMTAAGSARGDLMWRMPLFQGYRGQLKSSVADMSNCAEGGFGGAVTAALFLESFVKDVPWAHLDIYAWKDGPGGAFTEAGGSGQSVQALAEALTRLAMENEASGLA